eukprot:CAMPEP_0185170670 /NCGR_PEP_ID=MMETSP1139-20130426/19072_1 /TAXON_ID=298111 /ORGANISM="Pavlova sp., Strain CCMP459" /LENGTH=99 /DNA_ID=CAMNT_0027736243 /DNA_START=82 /DNA_END=379 /DNA_ORIENTATION=-
MARGGGYLAQGLAEFRPTQLVAHCIHLRAGAAPTVSPIVSSFAQEHSHGHAARHATWERTQLRAHSSPACASALMLAGMRTRAMLAAVAPSSRHATVST